MYDTGGGMGYSSEVFSQAGGEIWVGGQNFVSILRPQRVSERAILGEAIARLRRTRVYSWDLRRLEMRRRIWRLFARACVSARSRPLGHLSTRGSLMDTSVRALRPDPEQREASFLQLVMGLGAFHLAWTLERCWLSLCSIES